MQKPTQLEVELQVEDVCVPFARRSGICEELMYKLLFRYFAFRNCGDTEIFGPIEMIYKILSGYSTLISNTKISVIFG